MIRKLRLSPIPPVLIAMSLTAAPACAETLAEAIALAYQSNPTLQAQRAQLRATDEVFVQARSGYGPTIGVQGSASYNSDRLRRGSSGNTALPGTTTRSNLGSAQVVVDQPLYSGGRTTLEVRSAEQRIRAGREALRATEQNVVFSVIQAYVDVRRDAAALAIRRQNLEALALQLRETQARGRAGEVTRTDIAQAQAQLYAEEANLASAEEQYRVSKAAYATAVGQNPGNLAEEPPLPGVPATPEQAFELSMNTSPELRQSLFTERQSYLGIQIARSSGRPTLSLRGTFGYSATIDPLNRRDRDRALAGQAVLSIPIFSSGRVRSEIRQAAELNTSDRVSIEGTRRTMVQNVADAWNQMTTNSANIARQTAQVEAAALAFRGMRIEYRAGERSTLDVLIAEETLRDAELAELAARHDAYLGKALVLRYIGRLDARNIVESVPPYDPAEHFHRVRRKGSLPWEPVVKRLDRLGLPSAGQHPIPAPYPANWPSMAPASSSSGSGPIDQVPTAPIPGTVSNVPSR